MTLTRESSAYYCRRPGKRGIDVANQRRSPADGGNYSGEVGLLIRSEEQILGRVQMLKRSWLVILLAGCFATSLQAPTTNGLIGVVDDSTGAGVPSAEVNVVSQDTSLERTAVSDANGLYVVPQLARVSSQAYMFRV